jgi:hypothetical protein
MENQEKHMEVMAGGKVTNQGQPGNPAKVSYEQLEGIAVQLQQENNKLKERLQQVENQVSLVRLNFLFEVVKNTDKFPERLVRTAENEIEMALYPPRRENGNEETRGDRPEGE